MSNFGYDDAYDLTQQALQVTIVQPSGLRISVGLENLDVTDEKMVEVAANLAGRVLDMHHHMEERTAAIKAERAAGNVQAIDE